MFNHRAVVFKSIHQHLPLSIAEYPTAWCVHSQGYPNQSLAGNMYCGAEPEDNLAMGIVFVVIRIVAVILEMTLGGLWLKALKIGYPSQWIENLKSVKDYSVKQQKSVCG